MYDDIDGVPMEKSSSADNLPDLFAGKTSSKAPAFIPSKWESVDPKQVEAQAVTTSKWDSLDPPDPPKYDATDLDEVYEEVKRIKLREIEVKTVQYQDALESGDVDLKSGWTIPEQVESYRKKLLKKVGTCMKYKFCCDV